MACFYEKRGNCMKKKKRRYSASRRRRQRQLIKRCIYSILAVILVIVAFGGVRRAIDRRNASAVDWYNEDDPGRPQIDVQLLTINEYSRPGTPIDRINNIVIHYTANPGSTAQGNRNYFENLKDTHTTKASSHFVVGLEGEIIQCIPTTEVAYASNDRNSDTISIEVCHEDDTGLFSDATYQSLDHLTAWLCERTGLGTDQIIRHYDITGKICPKYYVEHEDAWIQFKRDVGEKMLFLDQE